MFKPGVRQFFYFENSIILRTVFKENGWRTIFATMPTCRVAGVGQDKNYFVTPGAVRKVGHLRVRWVHMSDQG